MGFAGGQRVIRWCRVESGVKGGFQWDKAQELDGYYTNTPLSQISSARIIKVMNQDFCH